MKSLEREVQALLHTAQLERKATLDPHRVDTKFAVGDQVMLRTQELLDAAEIGKLRPRWEGPFPVAAIAGPNTYTLTLPSRFRCSPTVNVDRLKPYYPRAGAVGPPGPVADPGQAGEYVVDQLLNRKIVRGRTFYLVRWLGHASAADSWEPLEHLAHCPERVAEYEAAAPRRPKARRAAARGPPPPQSPPLSAPPPPHPPAQPPHAPAPPPPLPPPGFVISPLHAPPVPAGAQILYWWPTDGWQRGTVERPCVNPLYSHVVRYRRATSALAGTVETLLDAASHGTRWVLLTPAARAAVAAP